MAPSLFDGTLPSGDYEYTVFKIKKHEYILVAYDISDIKKRLKQLDIDMDLIDKIYLAQSELADENISARVNDTCGISSLDSVLIYTCLEFIQSNLTINDLIKNRKLTSNYIYSKRNTKIEPKQLNLLLWMILLINSILILDSIKLLKSNKQLLSQKENFIQSNNLPQTSFQLKSIQEELQNIEKTQIDLRENIHYISSFKLNKTDSFKNITFSKNSINCSLKTQTQEREFKKYLQKQDKSSINIGLNL